MTPTYGTAAAGSITPSSPVSPGQEPDALSPTSPTGESFSSMLGQMISEVNSKESAATAAVNNLQSGGNVSLHQAVISMEEANTSFSLMVEVRNKMMDAYQEIMKMQV
jgi:flagellar hook-basal body complex protein FliE